jgi:rhamnose utilization protein RhaD (predicted bifunctional aldolase and dehydrogenase)/NAD(P)-dependent dehydrogenase (short-subunit alcohol dehydrogenase family)
MRSRWSDRDAADAVARYAARGVNEDLALRTYTTRLLGSDPALVLHGGGNTSVKTTMPDGIGEPAEVICVKGSGWDMGNIEPAGLPAVRLAPLRRLRAVQHLSDEEMVNQVRLSLLDSSAPTPSVETLLHAFLPHRFVDHSHANAVLSLVDQPDSRALAAEVWGDEMGFLPYVMPGFALAGAAAEIFDAAPAVKGLILDRHGIFTFGADARQSYELMIEMVDRAEVRIGRARRRVFAAAALPRQVAPLAAVAPILRGAVAEPAGPGAWRRLVLDFRASADILAYVGGAEIADYARRGVVTPDHIIRTKRTPLVLAPPDAADLPRFAVETRRAVGAYIDGYAAYFDRHGRDPADPKTMLDPMPRVVLVPGLGLFGLGRSRKEAAVAADVAVGTVGTVIDAESVGRFTPLPEAELFRMEYWSLEQAKLGKAAEKPLQRQVAVITGGAGAIGAATAALFARNGAEVAVLDRDGERAGAIAGPLGGIGVACDVTDRSSVDAAFARVVETFGGLDILVSNAGAAWQGRIGEVDDATLRRSFELNFFGHQAVAQAAVKVMLAQRTGGALLFNASKQAVNPGASFGPYGLPKAATLFLSRQYALDHGADGIRSNAVNADRIRSGLLTDAMVASRSTARGLSETEYMAGNLLGLEVTAADVAEAFLHQALALRTTGSVTTVDGGNIAAALR